MSSTQGPITADQLTIVPANEASWEDLQTILGASDPGRCSCQRYKTGNYPWSPFSDAELKAHFREQTQCGNPAADSTSGLVAYLGDEPVGWMAVEPRTAYPRLTRTPWTGRDEDKDDDSVWAVTCFATRTGFRKRGITYALAAASVAFARARGARALEAYPMIAPPGMVVTWGEMHVGSRQVFEDAGFTEVSHPSKRRVVMRIDFD